jgi:hypothetical protein
MKEFIHKFLPVKYYSGEHDITANRVITSFALQRSGQHLVIEWLCRGFLNDTVHFNHCRFFREGLFASLTPVTGRRVIYAGSSIDDSGVQGRMNLGESLPSTLPENLFYTVEDVSPNESMYQKITKRYHSTVILIIRDPANWLASSIRHGVKSHKQLKLNIETLKQILEIATQNYETTYQKIISIDYNEFSISRKYRSEIANKFDYFDMTKADVALERVSDFGGGSSFHGLENEKSPALLMERWREYENNGFFSTVLKDRKLFELSRKFFGDIKPLAVIEKLVNR